MYARENASPFEPYTKTFRVNTELDGDIVREVSRMARERRISDSRMIRHILRRYVRALNKRKAAA